MSEYLLEVNGLKVYSPSGGASAKKKKVLKAVDGVSFKLRAGETLGIVGESGCGKSTCGNSIIRLINPTEGQVIFDGRDLASLKGRELRELRRDIQMIFQDPFSSLNPRMRVRDIIAEPLVTHRVCKSRAELDAEVSRLMDAVGLPREYAGRYPARVLRRPAPAHRHSPRPRAQAEAHNLRRARIRARRVHPGADTEPAHRFAEGIQPHVYLHRPRPAHRAAHKHARGRHVPGPHCRDGGQGDALLLAHAPLYRGPDGRRAHPGPRAQDGFRPAPRGRYAEPTHLPEGCRFHPRCKYCTERCRTESPELRDIGGGHLVACHYPLQNAEGILR